MFFARPPRVWVFLCTVKNDLCTSTLLLNTMVHARESSVHVHDPKTPPHCVGEMYGFWMDRERQIHHISMAPRSSWCFWRISMRAGKNPPGKKTGNPGLGYKAYWRLEGFSQDFRTVGKNISYGESCWNLDSYYIATWTSAGRFHIGATPICFR